LRSAGERRAPCGAGARRRRAPSQSPPASAASVHGPRRPSSAPRRITEKKARLFHRAQRSTRERREQLWRESERRWARARPPLSLSLSVPPAAPPLSLSSSNREGVKEGGKEGVEQIPSWMACCWPNNLGAEARGDRSRRKLVNSKLIFFARVLV
jgi:hypothetical protein